MRTVPRITVTSVAIRSSLRTSLSPLAKKASLQYTPYEKCKMAGQNIFPIWVLNHANTKILNQEFYAILVKKRIFSKGDHFHSFLLAFCSYNRCEGISGNENENPGSCFGATS